MKKLLTILFAIILTVALCTSAMATASFSYPKFKAWYPYTALPLVGGKLYTYTVGTSTKANTYSDVGHTVPNTNPVILDSVGEATVYLSGPLKFVLKDSNDVLIYTLPAVQASTMWTYGSAEAGVLYSMVLYGGSQATIEAAITQIGADQATLYLAPDNWSVLTNLTIPANISLKIDKGALVNVASAATLTINGPLEAGLYQVFSCAGTGKVVFGAGAINKVYPQWWGAKGDGVTDDSAAIAAAGGSLGTYGGTVAITEGLKCLIDNSLTVPANVHLVGPHLMVGTPGDNQDAPYDQLGGTLIVNSSKTITMSSGSSLSGLLIYRKGMVFPAIDQSLFAGTAITLGGSVFPKTITGDDVTIMRCMILGFSKAIYSSYNQRPRFSYLQLDNLNGIEISHCTDVAYIDHCHAWPFATIETFAAGGAIDYTIAHRSGTAYYLHDDVSWTKMTDCFSWGYYRGIRIYGTTTYKANSNTLLGCGADNNYGTQSGSIGIIIDGYAKENRIIGCQLAGQTQAGIYLNTTATYANQIQDSDIWVTGSHGIIIDSGDAIITGNNIRTVINGITVTNVNSKVTRWANRFDDVTTVLNVTATNPYMFGGLDDCPNLAVGSEIVGPYSVLQSISSANPINLPPTGNAFTITGTTGFATINGGHAGRQVTFKFDGILKVTNGTGTDAVRLNSGADFTTAASSTLTIMHNGTRWFEVGRSN